MRANVIVFEASTFILLPAFYLGARKALGRSRNRAFLLGSLLFNLAIETAAVIGGVKNFYWYAQNDYYKHYPLGGYIVWLGLVPLAVVLLWYMVSVTSYLIGAALARKGNIWAVSAVAGAVAVCFFLMIEPVAVTNHWWTWNLKSFYLIDVPVIAWIWAFAAVFLFAAVYRLTIMYYSDPAFLNRIERASVRRFLIKGGGATRDLPWSRLLGLFIFRLAAAFVVFAVAMTPFMVLFWALANRGHLVPGW